MIEMAWWPLEASKKLPTKGRNVSSISLDPGMYIAGWRVSSIPREEVAQRLVAKRVDSKDLEVRRGWSNQLNPFHWTKPQLKKFQWSKGNIVGKFQSHNIKPDSSTNSNQPNIWEPTSAAPPSWILLPCALANWNQAVGCDQPWWLRRLHWYRIAYDRPLHASTTHWLITGTMIIG